MATVVSTALPDLDLQDSSTITVDTQDVTAKIVQVAIHFSQDVPASVLQAVQPLLPTQLTGAPE